MSGKPRRSAALAAGFTLALAAPAAVLLPAAARAAPANGVHTIRSAHSAYAAPASSKPKKQYPAAGWWRNTPSGGALYNGADYTITYNYSYVPKHRGSPRWWGVELDYTNNTNADITLTCTGADSNPGNVTEDIFRKGKSVQYTATATYCSDNPGSTQTLPASGTLKTNYAVFDVVPQLKRKVDINWSAFGVSGTSNVVNPWGTHVGPP